MKKAKVHAITSISTRSDNLLTTAKNIFHVSGKTRSNSPSLFHFSLQIIVAFTKTKWIFVLSDKSFVDLNILLTGSSYYPWMKNYTGKYRSLSKYPQWLCSLCILLCIWPFQLRLGKRIFLLFNTRYTSEINLLIFP